MQNSIWEWEEKMEKKFQVYIFMFGIKDFMMKIIEIEEYS